jgi:hypothetical protein
MTEAVGMATIAAVGATTTAVVTGETMGVDVAIMTVAMVGAVTAKRVQKSGALSAAFFMCVFCTFS